MRAHRFVPCLIPLLAVLAVPPLAADETPPNQLVVFGGVSILDASAESSSVIPIGPGFRIPGREGRFGSGRDLDVEVRTAASVGNSALFGLRYSRYVKGRLAVEADLQVAPTHDLEGGGELCYAGRCFGPEGLDDLPGLRRSNHDFGRGRRVTAWQYGAGLTYDVTGGDVRPVVLFGAGGSSWTGSGYSETDFELRFGAGLKILFGRLGARVDVIDHLVLDHFLSDSSEHNIHVTAGFLVGF